MPNPFPWRPRRTPGSPDSSHASTVARPPAGRAAFAFIFITVTLDMLALGVIAPVLPHLIVEFEGGNVSDAARMTGWFAFIWAAMQFVAAPVLGTLSDRFGRRPVLLLSLSGLGLDYVIMALAPSMTWLLVGRTISGITSATGPIATAYIADVTPAEQRAARYGLFGAAFGFGFVVGPAVGGILGAIDLRFPFWFAAILCLANAAYGWFVLPESLPVERRRTLAWRRVNPLAAFGLLRSHPELGGLAIVTILMGLAHESLPNAIVLYMAYRYGWDERTIGFAIAAIGASAALVGALLVGPCVRRFGDRMTLVLGLGFGTAGFLVYAFATTGRVFAVGIAVMSLWGLAMAPLQALMSRRVEPTEQGQLQGAITSLRGITGMIGPLLFSRIFAAAIDPAAPVYFAGAPFFVASLVLAAAGVVTWRATRKRPDGNHLHVSDH